MTQYTNYKYRIFDSTVETDLQLPELPPSTSPSAEILIEQGYPVRQSDEIEWIHDYVSSQGQLTLSCGKLCGNYVLGFPNLAHFLIDKSLQHIRYTLSENESVGVLRHLLLDQVLPRVFGHQFQTVFHASGVVAENRVVLFMGPSGVGKSTLATGFYNSGLQILSDDCLLLRDFEDGVTVVPAYSGIRLWEDSIDEIYKGSGLNEERIGKYGKFRISTDIYTSDTEHRLHSIVLLAPHTVDGGSSPQLKTVQKTELVGQLLRNCFSLDIKDEVFLKRQIQKFSKLVNQGVHCYSLNYPRDFEKLDSLINFLRKELWTDAS